MTPCERVEAVARAAWGVSRVDVSVAVLPSHAVAVVSSERTTDSVPRSQTATAPTIAAALLRAADAIAGGVSNSAAEARILARLAACVACAVPCREHSARCKGVAPCREVMPRVQIAWWLDRVAGCDDSLLIARSSRDEGEPWPHPTTIMRPLWWRRGRKGRACRDPRKRAATCKVQP